MKGGESLPDHKSLFFLAAFPKSGSTWMRALLSAYINAGQVNINKIVGSYGDTDGYFLRTVSPKELEDLSYFERLLLRPAMFMHMHEASMIEPVIVKTHTINDKIEGVHTIPHHLTRGAVVIVRDPRDVVISYADHMGKSLDDAIEAMGTDHTALRDDSCNDIKTLIGSWSGNISSWMGDNAYPVSVVTYEDMLRNTKWALGTVLEKIGWGIDGDRLKLAVKACEFSRLQKQEREHGFKEKSNKSKKFFRRGRSGGWRNVLTETQVAKIESDHGEVMRILGYLDARKEAA